MNTVKSTKSLCFFLRLPIALSLLGHGLVRLPKLQTFSEWMVGSMSKSAIPEVLIVPFSYGLPVLEAIIGMWLLIGIQMRVALYAAISLMSILIVGSCSIENWGAIEAQLIHAVYLGGLLVWCERTGQE